jgi:Mrp family chromosome partitioning ATPase
LRREGLVTEDQIAAGVAHAQRRNIKIGASLVELGYVSEADVERSLETRKTAVCGLLDVLGGERVENCIVDTRVHGLFVLPLGGAKPRHVSLLSPAAIRRMLDQASEKFDVVLVDTGPILGSIEAAVVAPEVSGVVMTVSRGEQRPLAIRSMDYLFSLGARVSGVVFNRAGVRDLLSSRYSSTASARISSIPSHDEAPVLAPRLGPVASALEGGEREPPYGSAGGGTRTYP